MNQQRETLLELGLNIVAPTFALLYLSDEARLGPGWGLALALAFPLLHAGRSVARSGGFSPLTVIAVVSVVLTGGIGLLALDARWFAAKEAALPLALAAFTVVSLKTPWPVVHSVLWRVLDVERVRAALTERGTSERFEGRARGATLAFGWITAGSAAGTFLLARWMVTSPTGTEAFNTELGRYTAVSFPAIALPVTIAMAIVLRRLLTGIEEDTGKPVDDLLTADDG